MGMLSRCDTSGGPAVQEAWVCRDAGEGPRDEDLTYETACGRVGVGCGVCCFAGLAIRVVGYERRDFEMVLSYSDTYLGLFLTFVS